MKKLILILSLLSATAHSQPRQGYVYTPPKAKKNFLSLMIGFGPTGLEYGGHKVEEEITLRTYNRIDKGLVIDVRTKYGPIFGAQYTHMFNSTFGGSLGFMSNSSAFTAMTIGW